MTEASIDQDGVEPRWLRPLSYCGSILLFVVLILLREEPWNKGSVAGLVLAACLSFGIFHVAGKIALGLHVAPLVYRPPVGEPTNLGWLEQPVGTLLQFIFVTTAVAGVALLG
jgi:hypothetical protein